MADEQKPVEVPEVAPAVVAADAPVETKPAETPAEAAPVTEDKPAEEAAPATEEAKAEDKKAEVKPVEEGHLSHKAQGASFPKNLIPTKEFFFFGVDALEPKALSQYQRSEKSPSAAHSNIAWASHTGKGLLFQGGDKKSPSTVINLSDATEPQVDGPTKFFFHAKGNKHSFKALTPAERDNWVSQLKLKIAEAKELLPAVTESETYKKTLESLKPTPIVVAKKEVKPEEPAKEEAKTEEPAKEEAKEEAKAETKAEPKARSSSRKRHSIFGFGNKKDEAKEVKKDEPKKDEVKPEEPAAADTGVAAIAAVPVAVEAPAAEPVAETEADKSEGKTSEEAAPVAEEKPAGSKRNSFFGGVFGKKEKKSTEIKPTEPVDATKDAEAAPAGEAAPVIPPVETTTPLAAEVASPATVPTETVDVTAPAATNGETKKDVKEKRKSSLPFAFGKREKSPAPADGEEKPSKGAFSKLRATIKGKTATKPEEKAAEEPAKETTEDAAVPAEATAAETVEEPAKPVIAEPAEETKPENVATTTPAVTAAA